VAAASAPQAHKSGKTFVVATTAGPSKLDPDVTTAFVDFQAEGLIYEQLVRYNARVQVTPDLATKWTYSDNNKVLTFHLRKGVKFDDGSTFTSADAVASLKRVINPKTGDAASSYLQSVKKIQAVGKYELRLTLKRPDTSLLAGLTSLNLSMLSTKSIKANNLATKPDGTGPFMFSRWSPGNFILMKANPHYWGGKPRLAAVRVTAILSEQSIASAVQAGTVQEGLLTQPTVVRTLSGYKVLKVLDLSYRALMLQDRKGPLAKVDNRRAIGCAVSRQQVVKDAVFGQGKSIAPVPIGPDALKPISALCPTQNLAKARRYLKRAGDAKGFSFTAITSTAIDPTDSAQAIAVQSQLAKVGIKMHIQNLASNAYIQDWLKARFQAAFAWNGANPDTYTMYGRYFGPGANLGGPAGYSSTTLQKLLVKGDEAPTAALAHKYYVEFQKNLTSNAVWVWLFSAYDYAALGHNVHGVTYLPSYTDALSSLAKAYVS
jgi:peptide/nickel transport system substrate-binding protein